MMDVFRQLLNSKKAIAAVAGVLIALAARVGLDLPVESTHEIIAVVVAYIVGQGLADFGKESRP